jgi:hypothetical protein
MSLVVASIAINQIWPAPPSSTGTAATAFLALFR